MATKAATKKSSKSASDTAIDLPSEKDLLAMPEADYMNDRQLAFFKERLRQLEQEILVNAGATTEHLRETQFVPDPADRATAESDRAFTLRIRDRERRLIRKIQAALTRIDDGTYGICEDCGDDISVPRLKARPVTRLCINCKAKQEEDEHLRGD